MVDGCWELQYDIPVDLLYSIFQRRMSEYLYVCVDDCSTYGITASELIVTDSCKKTKQTNIELEQF